MGHIARSIHLIKILLEQENTIIFTGNSNQLKIIRVYFPQIQTLYLEGYPFEFEKYKSFQQAIWKQKTKLYNFLEFEKKWVDEKVNEFAIDLVISDHRYGFRSSKVTSIFMTHQIQLPLKGVYNFFQFFHSRWMKQFDKIWIVDDAENRLAGKLSCAKKVANFEYIGYLSRFNRKKQSIKNQKQGLSVLLISGPDTQIKHLYDYYLDRSNNVFEKIIIGNSNVLDSLAKEVNFTYIESKNWLEIDEILHQATEIYSFHGYSTLMDAKYLSAEFHLIPSLNQWEQEYLSKIHPQILNQK